MAHDINKAIRHSLRQRARGLCPPLFLLRGPDLLATSKYIEATRDDPDLRLAVMNRLRVGSHQGDELALLAVLISVTSVTLSFGWVSHSKTKSYVGSVGLH